MSTNVFVKILKGLLLRGESSDPSDNINGSLWYNSTSNKLKGYLESAIREVLTSDQTQTLTNKTIDADLNTISNIENGDIKAGAAIDATKIADGSVSSTEFQYLDGVTSAIQTQINSKISASSTDTLTNKTIDGDDNTVQDLALTSLKTVLGDASKFVVRDASGVVISNTKNVPTGTVVGTSDTQTLTGKTIDGDDNTVQDLALTSLKTVIGDASKFVVRDASGIVISNTKDVPTGTVVGTSDTQTLTNKTLTAGNVGDFLDYTEITTPGNPAASTLRIYSKGDDKLYKLTSGGVETEIGSGASTGSTFDLAQASHGFSVGNGIYHNGSIWAKAKADVDTTLPTLVVTEITDANNFVAAKFTLVTASSHGFTIGQYYFQSEVTAGLPTVTEPTSGFSCPLFYVVDANTILTLVHRPVAVGATTNLDDLGDVFAPSPENLQTLQYNSSNSRWEAVSNNDDINYILNPVAEANVSGYDTYADAAGTSPVDGTGGSAAVTFTRSTSSPLRGDASFLITKDAANRQGQGSSYDFSIDDADKAKPLAISFDYTVSSGTYADGDLRVYLYDVTNAQVIEPAGTQVLSVTSGLPLKHKATFQTNSNSNSYRLIFHVASTSASAYVLKLDNLFLGPQSITTGAAVTDWKAYTPSNTSTWTTNTTFSGLWRRVGDSMEVEIKVQLSGAPNVASLLGYIPSGFTIDETKLVAGSIALATDDNSFGEVSIHDVSTGVLSGRLRLGANNRVIAMIQNASGTYTSLDTINATTPITFTTNDKVYMKFKVPIVGWSSNVEMSNDTDTRVVTAKYAASSPQVISAATNTVLTFASKLIDTHGAVSSSIFTAPVSGKYKVRAKVTPNVTTLWALGNIATLQVAINGTTPSEYLDYWSAPNAATYSHGMIEGEVELELLAGDTVRIIYFSSKAITLVGDSTFTNFSIERISGPSAIAASESVVARYQTSASQSIPNNTSTVVDFGTKVLDSHGSVTTGASWKFTAPVSGIYAVSSQITFTGTNNWASGEYKELSIAVNGSNVSIFHEYMTGSTSNELTLIQGSGIVRLNEGDYINIAIRQGSGAALALQSSAVRNEIHIHKIGN